MRSPQPLVRTICSLRGILNMALTSKLLPTTTSTNTNKETITISDNQRESYNRGPILTQFVPPTSCLSTLTYTFINNSSEFYLGHWGDNYYDTSCFPTTKEMSTDNPWALYYRKPSARHFAIVI